LVLIVAACSSFNALRLHFNPVAAKAQTAAVASKTPMQAPAAASPAAAEHFPSSRQHSPIANRAVGPKVVSKAPFPSAKTAVVESAEATPAAPAPDTAIHIELSAIEPTWLSITADGKQTYSGVLATAETKTLEGHETARIHTGNAGGVNVVFNGRALGTLGRRGQIRTVLFTRTGYEVLEPSAVMELTRFSRNGE
jgi:hypothetical protein